MVVTSIPPTEHSVRPKLRAWRSYSGVSEADAVADAVAETRAMTLTEPQRKSDGGREYVFDSDSVDERACT